MKKQTILFLCFTLSTILSAQVSKTVDCTAGALSSLLTASEKSTVTDLTLTGTIDARDFVTMRDNMPVLANIDMGSATISAYGTNLANQIPEWAFFNSSNRVSATNLTSIVMPTSITSIGRYAFYFCTGLTGKLTIPNSVKSIGDYAFSTCQGLTGSLTIPNSVTSIGEGAFDNCMGLTGSLTISNSVTSIGDGAFANCWSLSGSLTIPNSVTSIGANAFWNCIGFTGSLTIPNSVTSIGDNAFIGCYGFTGSLTIPNSVISIGDYAFDCSGLTGSITIPNSVTSIGDYAFIGCIGISIIQVDNNNPNYSSNDGILYNKDKTILIQCPAGKSGSLTIPNSVTSIGSVAFSNCTGLISINVVSQIPVDLTPSHNVFYNVNKSTCKLYVPKGSKTAYQSADQWKDFTNILEYDPNGINDITADGISLYITDGQLHIKNAPAGETVSIIAMSGMVVYIGVITSDELSVALPQSGVYIVTVGSKSQKVAY
jgi:hypothetical protein